MIVFRPLCSLLLTPFTIFLPRIGPHPGLFLLPFFNLLLPFNQRQQPLPLIKQFLLLDPLLEWLLRIPRNLPLKLLLICEPLSGSSQQLSLVDPLLQCPLLHHSHLKLSIRLFLLSHLKQLLSHLALSHLNEFLLHAFLCILAPEPLIISHLTRTFHSNTRPP